MHRFPSRAGPFMRIIPCLSGTVYAWISPTPLWVIHRLRLLEASDVRR